MTPSDHMCEQDCYKRAQVYAVDSDGVGGWYCRACARAMGLRVVPDPRPRSEQ
jgi:hypothetical protein